MKEKDIEKILEYAILNDVIELLDKVNLHDVERNIIELRYLKGYSMKAISSELKMCKRTVYTYKTKAINKINIVFSKDEKAITILKAE